MRKRGLRREPAPAAAYDGTYYEVYSGKILIAVVLLHKDLEQSPALQAGLSGHLFNPAGRV